MLRLNNISAGYKGTDVLTDFSLELIPGEILGVIGVNGSGKSTLLKAMLGALPIRSGEIILKDKPLSQWSARERSPWISLLDSNSSVSFPMSVGELVDLGFRHKPLHERRDLRSAALQAVGLENMVVKNILEMSSGECKRAFIAHILASSSKIMMLDEPFAHLDWSHQASLAENLDAWRKRQGTTFVLAIHELEWSVKVADRLCVLDNGKLVACGDPEKVIMQKEVREVFAFRSRIDENPLDGTRRLTLSSKKQEG